MLSNLNLLATAPGGVARLRELILTLAVQGKLVAQDPEDEPASALLKKIRSEKDQLIAEGKIKRDKPLAEIAEEEKPFGLPAGWKWERFGAIAGIERGGSPRPIESFLTDDPTGLNWIKIGDTEKGGKYITSASQKIKREGLVKTRMVFPGDFLLTNSMSFGRPYITQIEGCIHDGWLRISPPSSLNKDFLYLLLSSRFIRNVFEAAAAGGVVLNLNADKVRTVPIPLPPLSEQSRIVTRVEELMSLCDALEAKSQLEATQHAQLVSTLLATLTDSATPAQLLENWHRVATHFDLLLDRPEAVDALEQTILQLAVRGLLVPQDPQDEPASELLKKIRAEKDKLIAAGKIKRDKTLPPIEEEEQPFALPQGWEWVRMGLLGKAFDYGTSQKSVDDSSAVPVLRMGNIQNGRVVMNNLKYLVDREGDLPGLLLKKDDLLFNRTNSYELVGKTGLFEGFHRDVTFASYLIRVKLMKGLVSPQYVDMYMNSRDCRVNEIEPDLTQQTGQANYNGTKLKSIRIPLPPVAEQSRIVTRVAQLRRLCADLRQRMSASQATQAQLAEALVQEIA